MINRREILKFASFAPFFITPDFNINKNEIINKDEILSYEIETTFNLEIVFCSGLYPNDSCKEEKDLTTITIRYKNRECVYKTYDKMWYSDIENNDHEIEISSESFLQNAEIIVFHSTFKCIMSDCELISIKYF